MYHLHTLREILLANFAKNNPKHNTGNGISRPAQQKPDNAGKEHYNHVKHKPSANIRANAGQQQDHGRKELKRNF